jgi:hypothetical protein
MALSCSVSASSSPSQIDAEDAGSSGTNSLANTGEADQDRENCGALRGREIDYALTLDHLSDCGDRPRPADLCSTGRSEHAAASRTAGRHLRRELQQTRRRWHCYLYARDGVLVSGAAKAVKTGAQEIEQTYQSVFKSGMNHTDITVDQVWPLGTDAVIAIGEYRGSGHGQNGPIEVDGHWTGFDVREGGIWKVRLLTAFPNPPPAATGSAATPSGPMR